MNERSHFAGKERHSSLPVNPCPARLQRKCACGGSGGGECEECRKKDPFLQPKASGEAQPFDVPSIVQEVLSSPGQPLDRATRAFFEPRFGHDFSQVRIHTDSRAGQSASAVNALAYTVGQKIVFKDGHYNPGGQDGRRLLAHELTHVVQQRGTHPSPSLEISDARDAAEAKADQVGRTVLEDSGGVPIEPFGQAEKLQRQQDPGVPQPPSNLGPPVQQVPLPPVCSVGWKDGKFYWKCERLPGVGSTPEIPLDPRKIPDEIKKLLPKPPDASGQTKPPIDFVRPLPPDLSKLWLAQECERLPFLCKPQPPAGPPAPIPTPGVPELSLGSTERSASWLGSLTLDGFDINKAVLTSKHLQLLGNHAKVLADLLQRYPASFISVVGFADAPGKEERNRELGQERANAVMEDLAARGVPADVMRAASLGETAPRIDTKQYEPRNRRVEIFFNARKSLLGSGKPSHTLGFGSSTEGSAQ